MICLHLGIRSSYKKASDSGIAKAKPDKLSPKCPRFASSTSTAVSGVPCVRGKEKLLLFRGISLYVNCRA